MTIEVRQVCHPEAVRHFSTAELRRHFLIETLFVPGQIKLTYSHIDRLVVGGATPTPEPLTLESHKQIGSPNFLDRRELGVVNLGGAGPRPHRRPSPRPRAPRRALCRHGHEARCASNPSMRSAPAKFYLVSTPAHARFETVKIGLDRARRVDLGDAANGNVRTIFQMIHPEVCRSASSCSA